MSPNYILKSKLGTSKQPLQVKLTAKPEYISTSPSSTPCFNFRIFFTDFHKCLPVSLEERSFMKRNRKKFYKNKQKEI